MRRLLILIFFAGGWFLADAQSSTGTGSSKAGTHVKKSTTQQRGSGQYHGSKDTTPGSPMGTGGAGGNEMSGSPSGSASEAAIQSDKSNGQSGDAAGSQGSHAKKVTLKKKTATQKNRRM